MKRLYVAISHHGLGHLAQTAAVLAALHARAPAVEVVVRSALAPAQLAARLAMPFEQVAEASDCNLVMHDAIRVDRPASLAAYHAFHRDWQRQVDAEARRLEALKVDALYSNVGYLPLAAAQRAGLPAVALCSLNWFDIFRHYLGEEPGAGRILAPMLAAYAGAQLFLRPQPAMPMADLGNTVAIAPIAQPSRERRDELRARLGMAPETRLALIGMGGIAYRLPVETWPSRAGVVYLVPGATAGVASCVRGVDEAGMPFGDILASCDALITKPGYGSYVEAAAAGLPVLTLPRPDWPEAPYLNGWLAEHGRMLEISEAALLAGDLVPRLEALWALPARPPVPADGADAAAGHVLGLG